MNIPTTSVWITVEGRCWATCHCYPDRGPILSVYTPGGSLKVSGGARWVVSDEEVAFARDLQRAVTTYREQLEAFAARVDTGPEPVAGGDLA